MEKAYAPMCSGCKLEGQIFWLENFLPPRRMGSQSHTGILNPEQQTWEEEPTHRLIKIIRDSVHIAEKKLD